MDEKLHELIQTYLKERKEFIRITYLGDFWRVIRVFNKIRNLSIKEDVLSEEQNFILSFFIKIKQLKPTDNQLDLAILALENRNEYLNNVADYQVAYIALVAFSIGFAKLVLAYMPELVVLIAVLLMLFVCLAFLKRVELKDEKQFNQEIVNIFNKYRLNMGV